MLAELDPEMVRKLFGTSSAGIGGDNIPEADYPAFVYELDLIRRNSFAANFEGTEEGIRALGMSIHNVDGQIVSALSVAAPVARFRPLFESGLVPIMGEAVRQLEIDIAVSPADRR